MTQAEYNPDMSLKIQIQQKNKSLINLNKQLRKLALSLIESNAKIKTEKDLIAGYTLAKSFKTHGVALRLAIAGYPEDSDMLIRTMFDVALICSAVIRDETDATAIKYLRFDDSTRTKMFNRLVTTDTYKAYFEARKINPKPGDESIEDIEKRAEQWKVEYGKDFRDRWHTGYTTGSLAESLNLKKYFQTAYELQSQLTHSLPRVADQYLKIEKDEIVINVDTKESGVEVSLTSAFIMLMIVVEQFNDHHKIVSDKIFKDMSDQLAKISGLELDN